MTTYYARTDVSYSGGDKLFSITFPYIDKTHIKVFVNEEQTTNFTFNTSSQILINDNITAGDVVSIRRITPIDNKMVVFSNTSILNKDNQNLAQDQVFNAVQEMRDENTTFKLDIEADFEDYKDEVDDTISNFENEVNAAIEDIEDIAETAEANSSTALSNAATALSNSQSAVSTSETALSTVNTALANSEEAVTKANAAVSTANEAKTTATTASTNASTAVSTANSAVATANGAVTTANSADSKADTAVSTANTALSNSQSAVSTANAAETKADSAVSTANSASSTASTASTNASNAVTTANSALSTAQSADGKVDSFGQDISSVLAAADKINALEEAVTTATGAATTASTAAQTATTAAQTATQAASTLVVDQTYDGTSINAQSGVAIEGELSTNYQEKLSSGTNIKTVNNTTLLGSGNIDTSEIFVAEYGVTSYADVQTAYNSGKAVFCNQSDAMFPLVSLTSNNAIFSTSFNNNCIYSRKVDNTNTWSYTNIALARTADIPDISTKQDTLVSGTNIKTINSMSLLGSGNIDTSELFIAEYGVTSFADIETAYNVGKLVFVKNYGLLVPLINYEVSRASFRGIDRGSGTYNFRCVEITATLNGSSSTIWNNSTYQLELTRNLVTSISSSSTDTQYPSAKCVYDELAQNKVTITYED